MATLVLFKLAAYTSEAKYVEAGGEQWRRYSLRCRKRRRGLHVVMWVRV